jgi:hypothetical protein
MVLSPIGAVITVTVQRRLAMSTTRDLGYDSPLRREKGLPTEVAGPDWEFCMHLSDESPQIHFTVTGGQRSAVAMPVRMVP